MADWDDGVSASCTVGLIVRAGSGWPHNALRHHWLMPVSCHFRDCKSADGHESDSCKGRYNKCPVLTFMPEIENYDESKLPHSRTSRISVYL